MRRYVSLVGVIAMLLAVFVPQTFAFADGQGDVLDDPGVAVAPDPLEHDALVVNTDGLGDNDPGEDPAPDTAAREEPLADGSGDEPGTTDQDPALPLPDQRGLVAATGTDELNDPSEAVVALSQDNTCDGNGYLKPPDLDKPSGNETFDWGTMVWDGDTLTYTVNAGWTIDFCVKGGPNVNTADGIVGAADGTLQPPDHPSEGQIPAISHVGYRIASQPQATGSLSTTFDKVWDGNADDVSGFSADFLVELLDTDDTDAVVASTTRTITGNASATVTFDEADDGTDFLQSDIDDGRYTFRITEVPDSVDFGDQTNCALVPVVAVRDVLTNAVAAPMFTNHYHCEDDATLNFQKIVCEDYSAIRGNRLAADSPGLDDTGGGYLDWGPGYDNGASLPVSPMNGLPEGCWYADTTFSIGFSESGPFDEVSTSTGSFSVTELFDPEDVASILAGRLDLWVTEAVPAGQQFGALQCFDDALHPDNLEGFTIGPDDDAWCVAWNIGEQPDELRSQILKHWLDEDGQPLATTPSTDDPALQGFSVEVTFDGGATTTLSTSDFDVGSGYWIAIVDGLVVDVGEPVVPDGWSDVTSDDELCPPRIDEGPVDGNGSSAIIFEEIFLDREFSVAVLSPRYDICNQRIPDDEPLSSSVTVTKAYSGVPAGSIPTTAPSFNVTLTSGATTLGPALVSAGASVSFGGLDPGSVFDIDVVEDLTTVPSIPGCTFLGVSYSGPSTVAAGSSATITATNAYDCTTITFEPNASVTVVKEYAGLEGFEDQLDLAAEAPEFVIGLLFNDVPVGASQTVPAGTAAIFGPLSVNTTYTVDVDEVDGTFSDTFEVVDIDGNPGTCTFDGVTFEPDPATVTTTLTSASVVITATNSYTCVFGTVEEVPEPDIDVVKTAIGGVEDDGDGNLIVEFGPGDTTKTVTYWFVVTNTGDDALDPQTFRDDRIGDLTDEFIAAVGDAYFDGILPVGRSVTFTAYHDVTIEDFDDDDLLTNIATVTAIGVDSELPVSADDDETVTFLQVLPAAEELPEPEEVARVAYTGSDSGTLLTLGLLLSMIGLMILHFERRRRQSIAS